MKTRPRFVAAHSVPVLLGARSTADTTAPARSAPHAADVRSVAPAGLAAVAVDDLRPLVAASAVLERPVVLRASLEAVRRMLRIDREALELEGRETLVQNRRLLRDTRQQRLTERRAACVEPAAVA